VATVIFAGKRSCGRARRFSTALVAQTLAFARQFHGPLIRSWPQTLTASLIVLASLLGLWWRGQWRRREAWRTDGIFIILRHRGCDRVDRQRASSITGTVPAAGELLGSAGTLHYSPAPLPGEGGKVGSFRAVMLVGFLSRRGWWV